MEAVFLMQSELLELINSLRTDSLKNKNARIQHNQISLHIYLLQTYGTSLSEKYTKHIDEDIWELRPGNNRIFYFCWHEDTFVLLHHFLKKTDKTPRSEISRAKFERDEYIRRHCP